MSRREELEALAARVESLTGACRETDAAIVLAICPGAQIGPYGDCEQVVFHAEAMGIRNKQTLPTFTASLDAAMTLLPEGWRWCDYHWPRKDEPKIMTLVTNIPHSGVAHGRSSTPALALTAAALRALAQE